MKFISVFAALIAVVKAQHHVDGIDPAVKEQLTVAEEDSHHLIPNHNYVLKKNSTFLMENYDNLQRLFWAWQYQQYSPIAPLHKTDMVSTIMNEEIYTNHVVDAAGKFIGQKPYFIYWPKWFVYNNQLPAFSLNTLARHFEGKVAFRFADFICDENLRMSYEVYRPGKAFYIDEEGKAYIYPGVISFNATRDWIESRKYRMSPFQFKAPAVIGDYRLKWADIKKEVRHFYADNLRDLIEPHLRKIGFTYIVDMDPLDWDNIKLNQKTDRQIIFIVSILMWIIEYAYDLACSAPAGTKKPNATKSFLKKAPATEEKEKKPAAKKARGDKIE